MTDYIIIGIILILAVWYGYSYIKNSIKKGKCDNCSENCSSCPFLNDEKDNR